MPIAIIRTPQELSRTLLLLGADWVQVGGLFKRAFLLCLVTESLVTNNPLQVTQPKKKVSWSAVSRSPQDNIDVRIQATKSF